MLIDEFLNSTTQLKRILIVSDIKRANSLIRSYEAKYGQPMRNVDCRTLQQIAVDIYMWLQSESGFTSIHEFIDQDEAKMMFRSIIVNGSLPFESFFKNRNLMNPATISEVFRITNLFRCNDWTNQTPSQDVQARINDLKLLISEYEKALNAENKLDTPALYRFLITKMKDSLQLSSELPFLFNADLYCLREDTETFTDLECSLLSLLGCDENRLISVFPEELLTMEHLKNRIPKQNIHFFKGYGSFNEANYIANDILTHSLPFGSVTVLYTSESQLAALSSALLGNDIPMRILSNARIQDNPYIALARRILEWAKSNYSEKALNDVLVSSILYYESPSSDKDKTHNLLGSFDYFSVVLDARNRFGKDNTLGWGYEQNLEYVKRELLFLDETRKKIEADTNLDADAKKKRLSYNSRKEAGLLFLRDMLRIFGESDKPYSDENLVSPSVIVEKLIEFINKYVWKNNVSYPIGIGVLNKVNKLIRYEPCDVSLKESIAMIEEMLIEQKSSEPEDAMSVSISSINDWRSLERPNLYVIGLSVKEMQGRISESPVLSDEALTNYLSAKYIPTADAEKVRSEQNLYRTLMTFTGNSVSFGFSTFDTTGFYENNPSTFFREAHSMFSDKNTEDLNEFIYGNPTDGFSCQAPKYNKKTVDDIKKELIDTVRSSSRLERFLKCPKLFAYENISKIPDESFTEENLGVWLDPLKRGTLFHAIMEDYIADKCIKPRYENPKAIEKDVDEIYLDQCIEKHLSDMRIRYPATYDGQIESLRQGIRSTIISHLKSLLFEYTGAVPNWYPLSIEEEFKELPFPVESFDKTVWNFVIKSGNIDRIDYRIDEQSKTIYLRIRDYKTGNKDNKKKEHDAGALIQFLLYTDALMGSGKAGDGQKLLLEKVKKDIATLERNDDIKNWACEFDTFRYVFPDNATDDQKPFKLERDNMKAKNMIRLRAILTVILQDKIYPDTYVIKSHLTSMAEKLKLSPEVANELAELGKKYIPEDICQHCNYKHLCTKKSDEVK